VSKSRSNTQSWAAWGEERKERSRLRDYENWKSEAMEDLNNTEEVDVVLVIKNYFEPVDVGVELMEIVSNRFFETDEEAWGHLSDIAEANGRSLSLDENSLTLPEDEIFVSQYYVIEELWSK
jgi:hypothetical protein